MSTRLRTTRAHVGEIAAAVALGVTIACMVLGSSSVQPLLNDAHKLRWIALFALATVSVALVAQDLLGRRASVDHGLFRAFAFAAWFGGIALVSAAWSVDPRLTFGRAASFALLLVAAAGLALAARTRPALTPRLLEGLLAATVLVALAGLALLAIRHRDAVEAATAQNPARLRGLGENPDTASMLYGLVTPVALWMFVRARTVAGRFAASAAVLLLIGSISASGSRGGLLAAFVGGIVLALFYPATVQRRLSLALAVCIVMAGATAVTKIPKPLASVAVASPTPRPQKPGRPIVVPLPGTFLGSPEAQYPGRLTDELGRYQSGARSLFQSSGRIQAWRGAIHQADARPLLGYGFGTENKVFIDRFYSFNGTYVENSFVGLYLQLGAIGAASFVALLLALGVPAFRGARRAGSNDLPVVLAAVLATGVALMLAQSYVYSVGNVATVAFWVASFSAVSAATSAQLHVRRAQHSQEDVVALA